MRINILIYKSIQNKLTKKTTIFVIVGVALFVLFLIINYLNNKGVPFIPILLGFSSLILLFTSIVLFIYKKTLGR